MNSLDIVRIVCLLLDKQRVLLHGGVYLAFSGNSTYTQLDCTAIQFISPGEDAR